MLLRRHGGELTFSLTKPNVIVGPNGSGKSSRWPPRDELQLWLWHAIARSNCSKMPVIVATHSLWPFLAPKAFNISIEIPCARGAITSAGRP